MSVLSSLAFEVKFIVWGMTSRVELTYLSVSIAIWSANVDSIESKSHRQYMQEALDCLVCIRMVNDHLYTMHRISIDHSKAEAGILSRNEPSQVLFFQGYSPA